MASRSHAYLEKSANVRMFARSNPAGGAQVGTATPFHSLAPVSVTPVPSLSMVVHKH